MVDANQPEPAGRASNWSGLRDALISLQSKATILVVGLTLLVTAGVVGYLLRTSVRSAQETYERHVSQMASLLADSAAPLIYRSDLNGLQTFAERTANGTPLIFVSFEDAHQHELAAAEYSATRVLDKVRAGWSRDQNPSGIPRHHPPTNGQQPFVEITYPITYTAPDVAPVDIHSRLLVGYVHVGMSVEEWHRSVATTLDVLTGVGILALTVAVPLGFLLVRKFVAPLDELAGVMEEFSHGRLDVRIPVRRNDEIGRLQESFNRMADEHQLTHDRIVRLNAELEERVARRTEQLRELAVREPLTGLYNRRHFNDMLDRRMGEALRYGSDLSCMMIDLDDFKSVNDAYGHHVGDKLLVVMARTIQAQLRTSDLAARYGGDEFVVLLPQTGADSARVLGERIMEKLAIEVATHLPKLRVGMSVGIASAQDLKVTNADLLLRAADAALYDAKTAGKNCIMTAERLPGPTLP